MVDIITDRLFDHARDTRDLRAKFDSSRFESRWTNCPACGERPCDRPCCERCERRHYTTSIELRPGAFVFVCDECQAPRECAGCSKALPYWQLTTLDGETFCKDCGHHEPMEAKGL